MTLVTTDWISGMFALTNPKICVRTGITNAMTCVATLTTVAAIVDRMGASPCMSDPSCWTKGRSSGATVLTRFPSASETGRKAGASVPAAKSESAWSPSTRGAVSTAGIMLESESSTCEANVWTRVATGMSFCPMPATDCPSASWLWL